MEGVKWFIKSKTSRIHCSLYKKERLRYRVVKITAIIPKHRIIPVTSIKVIRISQLTMILIIPTILELL